MVQELMAGAEKKISALGNRQSVDEGDIYLLGSAQSSGRGCRGSIAGEEKKGGEEVGDQLHLSLLPYLKSTVQREKVAP